MYISLQFIYIWFKLFPFVDYDKEYEKVNNKNQTSFTNFKPMINLNHNI